MASKKMTNYLLKDKEAEQRWVAYFHELDAWTEYWDIYHPETRGRYYFGDGGSEEGLLTRFLPREITPLPFIKWRQVALQWENQFSFFNQVQLPEISTAITDIDILVSSIFIKHFGDAKDTYVQEDYLKAMLHFATNNLPAAKERDARISNDDPRKETAARHTLAGDIMWFAWALEIEAARCIRGPDECDSQSALMLAAVAVGCAADFTWHAHRRTRKEYAPDEQTAELLLERGLYWASDINAASREVHALYRIREWGEDI